MVLVTCAYKGVDSPSVQWSAVQYNASGKFIYFGLESLISALNQAPPAVFLFYT